MPVSQSVTGVNVARSLRSMLSHNFGASHMALSIMQSYLQKWIAGLGIFSVDLQIFSARSDLYRARSLEDDFESINRDMPVWRLLFCDSHLLLLDVRLASREDTTEPRCVYKIMEIRF